MDRERADWQARLTAFEASSEPSSHAGARLEQQLDFERAEFARRCSMLEQQNDCLQGQLEATQRQLRPYRLLDCLGVVNAGYSWARKLKARAGLMRAGERPAERSQIFVPEENRIED